MYEAKFLSQPVGIELLGGDHQPSSPPRPPATAIKPDEKNDVASPEIEALSAWLTPLLSPPPRLLFTNRYGFLSLDHLSTTWRLRSSSAASAAAAATGADSSSLAGGSLTSALSGLAPGESREISVEIETPPSAVAVEPRLAGVGRRGGVGERAGELFLHVEARLAAESAWAPEGHLIAWGCFPVSGLVPATGPPARPAQFPPALGAAAAGDGPRGAALEAAKGDGEGSGGGGDAVAGAGSASAAVPEASSPGFIAYEDEDGSAPSSREVSPLLQL